MGVRWGYLEAEAVKGWIVTSVFFLLLDAQSNGRGDPRYLLSMRFQCNGSISLSSPAPSPFISAIVKREEKKAPLSRRFFKALFEHAASEQRFPGRIKVQEQKAS